MRVPPSPASPTAAPAMAKKFNTLEAKQAARRHFAALRRSLSQSVKQERSAALCHQIANSSPWSQAEKILFYWPLAGEADVRLLLQQAQKQGKQPYLPLLDEQRPGLMEAAAYTGEACLQQGEHGIWQPQSKSVLAPEELDLILIPALAFDVIGYRLGFGGGYYDRYLLRTQAIRLGVCWECCFSLKPLPREKHDVPVHYIMTEERCHMVNKFF